MHNFLCIDMHVYEYVLEAAFSKTTNARQDNVKTRVKRPSKIASIASLFGCLIISIHVLYI